MSEQTTLLQGTLDLLVLKTLTLGPLHGWGISKRIRRRVSALIRRSALEREVDEACSWRSSHCRAWCRSRVRRTSRCRGAAERRFRDRRRSTGGAG